MRMGPLVKLNEMIIEKEMIIELLLRLHLPTYLRDANFKSVVK